MKYKWQAKSIDVDWFLDHNLRVAHGRGNWKNGVRNPKKSRLIKFYQMNDREDGHSDDKYHVAQMMVKMDTSITNSIPCRMCKHCQSLLQGSSLDPCMDTTSIILKLFCRSQWWLFILMLIFDWKKFHSHFVTESMAESTSSASATSLPSSEQRFWAKAFSLHKRVGSKPIVASRKPDICISWRPRQADSLPNI